MKNERILPAHITSNWKDADWDTDSMTASKYTYRDDENNRIELTEDELARYSFGDADVDYDADGNVTGGAQGGWLNDEA